MLCIACGRSMLKPAYIAPAGWMLGPKCLERADLLPKAMRQAVKAAGRVKRKRAVGHKSGRQEAQLDFFDGGEIFS